MDTEKKARLLSQAEGNQGAAARMKKEGPGYRQLTLEFPPTEDEKEQEAIIEAVLFTMGQSVESRQLAAAIGQSEDCARKAALRLKERYDREKKGIQIIELENAFQMCTRAEYYENLIRVAATPKRQVLTEVVLETLSIIAYRQPVTKMEIEKIRGVKSDHAVNKLIEYNLVCEVGRLDAPGRPALFATTEEFLRRFGIGSTNDLPGLNPEQEEEILKITLELLQFAAEGREVPWEKMERQLRELPEQRETILDGPCYRVGFARAEETEGIAVVPNAEASDSSLYYWP